MSNYILPVDRYELRNALLKLPGVWVCGKGYCIAVEDLNNAIDDMKVASKEDIVNWLFKSLNKAPESDVEACLDEDLSKLLTYNEMREYAGLKPFNGHDEYLEVK